MHMEKNLDNNDTRMLQAILNKSWRQHPIKQQLYRHLPPITKTIQVRQTRHAGHCWKSKDELLWTPSHGWVTFGPPARTYLQQLFADTGCILEDLLGVMDNKDKGERESGRSMLVIRYDDDSLSNILGKVWTTFTLWVQSAGVVVYANCIFTGGYKVKLVTLVQGDLFNSYYTFPGLLHFTLDTYLILLSVKQLGIKYHF